MANLTTKEKITEIELSSSISELRLDALPETHTEEYYFISYSHKDYKKVYKDILLLQEAGINIWYDRGMVAGKSWRDTADEAISKYDCAGVIFYISENSISSDAIADEIEYVKKRGKDYFSINLTHDSALDLLLKAQSDISKTSKKYKTIADTFSSTVIYVDYFEPIVKKIDAIKNLKRQEILEYKLDDKNDFAILSKLNKKEIRIIEIPQFVYINKKQYEVRKIGDAVFADCNNLEKVIFPPNINFIGHASFCGCENLKTVENFDSVNIIGVAGFLNCKSLELNKIRASKIGGSAFINCTSLCNLTIDSYSNSRGPQHCATVTIGAESFNGCNNLTHLHITNDGKNFDIKLIIGDSAFNGLSNLESLTIDSDFNYGEIGERAFAWCGMETIDLSMMNIERIEDLTFWNCFKLESFLIPRGVKFISQSAFDNCHNLKNIPKQL